MIGSLRFLLDLPADRDQDRHARPPHRRENGLHEGHQLHLEREGTPGLLRRAEARSNSSPALQRHRLRRLRVLEEGPLIFFHLIIFIRSFV